MIIFQTSEFCALYWETVFNGFFIFIYFFIILSWNSVYSAYTFHLQTDGNMISKFISYSAFNFPESQWFASHQTSPGSTEKVYWLRRPSFNLILVHQTSLYYISYNCPFFISCSVGCLVRFASQENLILPRTNWDVMYLQYSAAGAIQQLREAIWCWLDFGSSPRHTHLHNGLLFPCWVKDPKISVYFMKVCCAVSLRGTVKLL